MSERVVFVHNAAYRILVTGVNDIRQRPSAGRRVLFRVAIVTCGEPFVTLTFVDHECMCSAGTNSL